MKRAAPAIAALARQHEYDMAVVIIDGAKINKMMPADAINPNSVSISPDLLRHQMNLSDGGKNRQAMRVVGVRGLRSVLEEHGQWEEGMKLAQARERLWEWSAVQAQLTQVEEVFKAEGIVFFYNPKAHPVMSPIEVEDCQAQNLTPSRECGATSKVDCRTCLI